MFQFPIRNIEHFIAQTRHQLHITTKNEKPHRVEAVAGPGWLVADQLLVTKWVTSNSARAAAMENAQHVQYDATLEQSLQNFIKEMRQNKTSLHVFFVQK